MNRINGQSYLKTIFQLYFKNFEKQKRIVILNSTFFLISTLHYVERT